MGFLYEGPVGDSIEDYDVGQVLGQGGFATVYKATNKLTQKEVAIKMIDIPTMRRLNMIERVREEVSIHHRLKHPSILEMYNFFQDQNYIYLVLEYCRNGEIGKYLKKHHRDCLTEPEAQTVFEQILQGVHYLHKNNIVHRDLTLSNLLLTEHNRVKIADFGLAMQLNHPADRHLTMCGTPNYIAPEVATKSPHGPAVDVWSLGVLLYTLLTGKPPFDTPQIKSTLTKVIREEVQIPLELSDEAKDLLFKLLCKDPVSRIPLHEIQRHPFMQKHPETPLMCCTVLTDSGFATSSGLYFSNASRICSGCEQLSQRTDRHSSQQLFREISLNSGTNYDQHHLGRSGTKNSLQKPPQLNTARLKPVRNVSGYLVFHILNDGSVCLEFLRSLNNVKNCLRVSPDGSQIWTYPVQKPLKDKPPDVPQFGCHHYFYRCLPNEVWRRYNMAYTLVEKVKSNTVKMIVYTQEAVFRLMETSPEHFTADFYSGINIAKSGDLVRIQRGNEEEKITFNNILSCLFISKSLIQLFLEGFKKCLDIEKNLTEISPAGNLFPASFGQKPTYESLKQPTVVNCSVEKMSLLNSLNTSLSSQLPPARAQSTPKFQSRVWLEGIGEITMIGKKCIKLSCFDGTQLIHDPCSARITYKDAFGGNQVYAISSNNENIPQHVLAKLRIMKNALREDHSQCIFLR